MIMETEVFIGGMAIVAGVLIYHTRLIFQMKAKVDFIYDNLKTTVSFKNNKK